MKSEKEQYICSETLRRFTSIKQYVQSIPNRYPINSSCSRCGDSWLETNDCDSKESSYYLGGWTLRFLLLFSKAKKVSKNAFSIYPRHFPSFHFATNGTTDKAHDLIRTNTLLASQLWFKERLCSFSPVALRSSAAGKLLFEPNYYLRWWILSYNKSTSFGSSRKECFWEWFSALREHFDKLNVSPQRPQCITSGSAGSAVTSMKPTMVYGTVLLDWFQ